MAEENYFDDDDENLSQDCSCNCACDAPCTTRTITSTSTSAFNNYEHSHSHSTLNTTFDLPSKHALTSNRERRRLSLVLRTRSHIGGLLLCAVLSNILETSAAFAFQLPIFKNSHFQHEHVQQLHTTTATSTSTLYGRSSSSTEEAIKPVQPLRSSTKEKRLSVQKAWEQAQILAQDDTHTQDETLSATPFLDLFTDAGIATVKKVPPQKIAHSRPAGRPQSVPGAMSRATLLNLNEIEMRQEQLEGEFGMSASFSSSRQVVPVPTTDTPPAPKKRGRGRPRKNQSEGSDALIDEITSIAATTGQEGALDEDGLPLASGRDEQNQRVKILSSKSRKINDYYKEGETTGMMQSGRRGESEPPNLQRYYRTQLLTQEEEYTLGMKIQFLMKCEEVHEGLFDLLGRAPSIAEWAQACGFTGDDPVRCNPDYQETDLELQIRPVKSEAWDVDQDPDMFVGNGLANDSGPGRGRGRAKKVPPVSLKDYYDDSEIRFEQDTQKSKKKAKQEPINRGTPEDFVELMLTAKEAKQRMVHANMRLVVSISKRYRHVGVNIADLVQEGSIGLTRAAEKFDPKKGFKFSTYASW